MYKRSLFTWDGQAHFAPLPAFALILQAGVAVLLVGEFEEGRSFEFAVSSQQLDELYRETFVFEVFSDFGL
jgi:hypothetical protein